MPFHEIKSLSRYSKLMIVLACVILIGLSFGAGISLGYNRALFSYGYYRNVDGLKRFLAPILHMDINANGIIGRIISVNLPAITVIDRNQSQQIIDIGSTTIIRVQRSPVPSNDLREGLDIVVIGKPNSANHIEASFIRIISSSSTDRSMMKQGK